MQLANIHEEQFLKPDIAAARLEQVLEIDPNHEDAYFALERCYRKLRQWLELIDVYERHISATLDRKTKVELYAAIAQVYADEIEDTDKAIDAYRNIVDLDDTNLPALEALSKLYDKAGDASQSIDYMTRVAELTQDTKQRVESFYRIGKALDEKLGDRVSAQDRYEMALDLDPSHLPTLGGASRQIAMDNADYDKAARYIDQEQSYTPAPRQRARLLVELGRLREEMLGDHDSAVLAWEASQEADPENEDVGAAARRRVHRTRGLGSRRAAPRDAHPQGGQARPRRAAHAPQQARHGHARKLGKDDKAFKAYSAAHQLDLTDQATIRGLAEVCFRLKDWGAALTNFQKVLTSLGEDENERARGRLLQARLHQARAGAGEAGDQQLREGPRRRRRAPAHARSARRHLRRAQGLEAGRRLQARRSSTTSSTARSASRCCSRSATSGTTRTRTPRSAIEALEEAKDLQPENHPLLHKMLALYEATQNWARMVDTIQVIADMEKDPVRKSKFIFTMAQLYRDKENDQERAVELFNEALDLNPELPRGLRAHQQDPHRPEGLEGARARVPQDAPPPLDDGGAATARARTRTSSSTSGTTSASSTETASRT